MTTTKVHVLGFTPEELENKTIILDLTRNLRGKSLELKARIKNVQGNLEGVPISMEVMPAYIRRAIRKGSDYVEDSFEAMCKDAKLRIKPFMITRKRVSRSVRRELRDATKKHLEAHLKIRSAEEIFSEITSNKMQKELSLKLKKIYPLAFCEIRMISIVPEAKTQEARQ